MNEKVSFKELIIEAQNGNSDATEQLINRLSPLIKKYSFKLGYDEAGPDLSLWILETVSMHKPNVIWELNKSKKQAKKI